MGALSAKASIYTVEYWSLELVVEDIVTNETIYIYKLAAHSKEKTLLEFYIPKWKKYKAELENISSDTFLLTDIKSLIELELEF